MTITITLEENDFLIHQLFLASKSYRIKKKRQKNKIVTPIIYIVIGILLYIRDILPLALAFWVLGILWFFIYPIWERRHYLKHYEGFIKDNYKTRIGKISTLEINDDYLFAKDDGSEGKVLTSEIEEICEIPNYLFIRLKGSVSFILPKNKISDFEKVISRLKELAIHLKINYNIDDKWEWK